MTTDVGLPIQAEVQPERVPGIFDRMAGEGDGPTGGDAPAAAPPAPPADDAAPATPEPETPGEVPADEPATAPAQPTDTPADEGETLSDEERAYWESDRAKELLDARRRAWNAEARGELERHYSDKIVRALTDPEARKQLNSFERRAVNAAEKAVDARVQARLSAAGVQPDRPPEEAHFDAYEALEREARDSGLSLDELQRSRPDLYANLIQFGNYKLSLGLPPDTSAAQVRQFWRAGRTAASEARASGLAARLDPDELFGEFAARPVWATMTEAERESLLPEKFTGDDPADVAAQMRERMGEVVAAVKNRTQRAAVLGRAADVNRPVEAARTAARTAPPAVHGTPAAALDYNALRDQWVAAVESGEIDRLPDLDRAYQEASRRRSRGGASWIP